jgi:LPXTG-motif cell wall-anchored protein
MTSRKLASAVAATSLAGAAVLGMSAPASAQSPYPISPSPAAPGTGTPNDSTPAPGQAVVITFPNGSFTGGSQVVVSIPELGINTTATATPQGGLSFSFTVPAGTRPGRVTATFAGTLNGAPVVRSSSFTVVAAAATSPGRAQGAAGNSSLPRTGSDQIVPLTIAGLALVGVGAGIVVSSRRRREDIPGGVA